MTVSSSGVRVCTSNFATEILFPFIMSIRIWVAPFSHLRGCITLLHSVKGTNEHSHFVVDQYSYCFFPSPPARCTYSQQHPLLRRCTFMLLCFVHKPNFTIRTNQQINRYVYRPSRISGGQSPACHRARPRYIPSLAVYQAANLQPVTAQGRVIFRAIPRGICGGQSKSETGFALSTSASSYHYHSTIAPYLFFCLVHYVVFNIWLSNWVSNSMEKSPSWDR